MASNGGTSGRPTRVRRWVVVSLILMLALWWASRWMAGPVVVERVEVAAVEAVPEAAPTEEAPVAVAATEDEPVEMANSTVDIWLRHLRHGPWMHYVPSNPIGQIPLDEPEWDFGLLQAYETYETLFRVSAPGQGWYGRVPDEMFAAAREEGLFDVDPAQAAPEEALLALLVEWFHAVSTFREAYIAFVYTNVPEGETWASIGHEARQERINDPDLGFPVRDHGRVQELAEASLQRWPDHPLADVARLATLPSRLHPLERQDVVGDEVLDVLQSIRNPVVREQGLLMLTSIVINRVDSSILDFMEELPSQSARTDLMLAAWGVVQTTRTGRWKRAERWTDRLEKAWEATCGVDPDNHLYACGHRTHELLDTNARLIALGYKSPSTWKEALVSQAWSCHLETPHEGTSNVEAIYDGEGWVYGEWDRQTDVTWCLSAATHLEVMPDKPTKAKIVVHDVDPMGWTR